MYYLPYTIHDSLPNPNLQHPIPLPQKPLLHLLQLISLYENFSIFYGAAAAAMGFYFFA